MIHESSHPQAGKTLKIKQESIHKQVSDFAGSDFKLEDWWDKVGGISWKESQGNFSCIVYKDRATTNGLPLDDEVVYDKIGAFGHLVHVSELEGD